MEYGYDYHQENTELDMVGEDAGRYNEESFERVFAKRTLANLEFIEKEVESKRNEGFEDKDIDYVFEVTQLINSFVGLLIFPKESYYRNVRYNDRFISNEANEIINQLNNSTNKFRCSYQYIDGRGENRRERLSPKTLARHFRNAVAHNHLSILPKSLNKDSVISGVEFSDNDDNGSTFWLSLDVKEIRILLVALCELILSKE